MDLKQGLEMFIERGDVMRIIKKIFGYLLVAGPPLYAYYLLKAPGVFLERFSPNSPVCVAAALLLGLILMAIIGFGFYLLWDAKASPPSSRREEKTEEDSVL